jgi:hypothetical protein
MIQNVGNQLLACLTVAAQAADNPPKNFGFLPGQQAIEDLSAYDDLCCDGTAYVRFSSRYPSGNFPEPDGGQRNCDPVAWAVVWELGIMRCADPGTVNHIVTMAEWSVINTQHLTDEATLCAAVASYKSLYSSGANDAGVLIGVGSPLGPAGRCIAQILSVTTQIIGCGP